MKPEIRRVPQDWVHPRGMFSGPYPLYDSLTLMDEEKFIRKRHKYDEGEIYWHCSGHFDGRDPSSKTPYAKYTLYKDYHGPRPSRDDYMPSWPDEVATHLMAYSPYSNTPMSGVHATPEELARELAKGTSYTYSRYLGEGVSEEVILSSYEDWLACVHEGLWNLERRKASREERRIKWYTRGSVNLNEITCNLD